MFKRTISFIVLLSFNLSLIFNPIYAFAQNGESPFVASLPVPGTMINLSSSFVPMMIKGIVIHPENPFNFDFIVDTGNDVGAISNRPYFKSLLLPFKCFPL